MKDKPHVMGACCCCSKYNEIDGDGDLFIKIKVVQIKNAVFFENFGGFVDS